MRLWEPPETGVDLAVEAEDPSGWLASTRQALGERAVGRYIAHVTLLHHSIAAHISNLDDVRDRFTQAWSPTECSVSMLVSYGENAEPVERLILR